LEVRFYSTKVEKNLNFLANVRY